MRPHDFAGSLAYSHSQEDAGWWPEVYRQAFGRVASLASVREDGWAQRAGIDRVVTLATGKVVKIDEKVRRKDYDDILLERWSDLDRKTPGWVQKPLDADFIAYAFEPSCRCYLLPVLPLQRSWRVNGREWVAAYGTRHARNEDKVAHRTWTTESVPVPIPRLLEALTEAITVRWNHNPKGIPDA